MKKTENVSYMILAGCCALLMMEMMKTPEGRAILKEALDEKRDANK